MSVRVLGGIVFFAFSVQIDDLDGKRCEVFVGGIFFVEGFFEKVRGVVHVQELSPTAQAAVGGDFVVLDFLGGANKRGVAEIFLDEFGTFGDETLHGLGLAGGGFFAEYVENLLYTTDVFLGFLQMSAEGVFEFLVLGGIGHFGEGFDQLFFTIVDVLKFREKSVVELAHRVSCVRRSLFSFVDFAELKLRRRIGINNT
jgi:hypothetical protein